MVTSFDIAAWLGWLFGTIGIFVIVDGVFYFLGIKKTTGRLFGTYLILAVVGLPLDALEHRTFNRNQGIPKSSEL